MVTSFIERYGIRTRKCYYNIQRQPRRNSSRKKSCTSLSIKTHRHQVSLCKRSCFIQGNWLGILSYAKYDCWFINKRITLTTIWKAEIGAWRREIELKYFIVWKNDDDNKVIVKWEYWEYVTLTLLFLYYFVIEGVIYRCM